MTRSQGAVPARKSSPRIGACQLSRQLARETLPPAILVVGWGHWLGMGMFLFLCLCLALRLSGIGSRDSSRRSHRLYLIHARVTETIEPLHFLADYSTRSEWPLQALNADQSMVLPSVRRLHA